jgi:hypothetical protein
MLITIAHESKKIGGPYKTARPFSITIPAFHLLVGTVQCREQFAKEASPSIAHPHSLFGRWGGA